MVADSVDFAATQLVYMDTQPSRSLKKRPMRNLGGLHHPDGADEDFKQKEVETELIYEPSKTSARFYGTSPKKKAGPKLPPVENWRNETIREYSDYMESDLAPSQAWGKRQESRVPSQSRILNNLQPEPKHLPKHSFWGKLVKAKPATQQEIAQKREEQVNRVLQAKRLRDFERSRLENNVRLISES